MAEINNTPWGERAQLRAGGGRQRARRAGLAPASRRQGVPRLAVHRHGHPTTTGASASRASGWRPHGSTCRAGDGSSTPRLELRRREITGASWPGCWLRYPLMTARVVAVIYWQAGRLMLKGVPFYRPPAPSAPSGRKRAVMSELMIPAEAPAMAPVRVAAARPLRRAGVARICCGGIDRGRVSTWCDGEERYGLRRPPSGSLSRRRSRSATGASTGTASSAGRSAPARPTWPGSGQPTISTAVVRIFTLQPPRSSDGMDEGLARLIAPLYRLVPRRCGGTPARKPAQHRGPLRPGQRLLPRCSWTRR